jgi:para-aminobenzoate synthetase component 1
MNSSQFDQRIENIVQRLQSSGPVVLLETQNGTGKTYIGGCPSRIFSGFAVQNDAATFEELLELINQGKDWFLGYFGYDVKNLLNTKLASKNTEGSTLPDFWFMIPDVLYELDTELNTIRLIKGKELDSPSNYVDSDFTVTQLRSNVTQKEYIDTIHKIQHDIKEGEYYEINYSRLITARFEGNTWGLYKRMKKENPVPMAAYMFTEQWQLCCASPEVFLIKQGIKVYSKPIKGTRKRDMLNESADEILKNELQTSLKERAENLMIVDLVRNDFNQIAEINSVNVTELFAIKSYATVHQMESTIEAELKESATIKQILQATFPMGSMTGAPKIAAMNAIDTYESYKRNVYSGSIGCIKPNGDFTFNVVIRTAIIQNGNLFYGTGGAITSDSIAQEEWNETELKTAVLQKAIQV